MQDEREIRVFTDMMGREVQVCFPPRRIVSLVPSQTELLFDLGLENEVVGITWFCIHPAEKLKGKTKIGGTKNIKPDKIRELQPDLIIANKEENEREQVEALAAEFPVWVSDISDMFGSAEMIRRVGEVCGKAQEADAMARQILHGFAGLSQAPPLRTLYLIWKEPWMSIGSDTFIHHTLERCGLVNVCEDMCRYPSLEENDIKELNPELVFLSSEPYPFQEKHIAELQALLPQARIMLVDGEMFSWYGSRLRFAPGYLEGLIGLLR